MEKKVEFTMVKTKERYLCGNFWFNESLLNEDFERLMKRFYDNGIECMGIRHDRGKNVSTHYHIVTFPFVPKAEFEIITDIIELLRVTVFFKIADYLRLFYFRLKVEICSYF